MHDALSPEENGVAIAAPQVGELLRIFIVAGRVFETPEQESGARATGHARLASPKEGAEQIPAAGKVFINPEIIRSSRAKENMSEGCLSVRGVYGVVPRHEKTSVRALDEQGKQFTYHGTGLLAQIFQHEVDHLNGILFTDKAVSIHDPE